MHQQQVILESSPAYVIVCIVLALGIAFLLYKRTPNLPWNNRWNWVLFSFRAILSFILMFLLLGPIVKQLNNLFEKPIAVVLFDNSTSVKETSDTVALNALVEKFQRGKDALEAKGYDVRISDLNDESDRIKFTASASDLDNALKKVEARYEGKKIQSVVLISDGIYNTGVSPLYGTRNFTLHTVGLGDTTQRTDLAIKNLAYNKIAYEGNKFPLRVEVAVKNLQNQQIKVSISHQGKVIEHQTKSSSGDQLITYDFQPLATDKGIQKIDIHVDTQPGESNIRNNNASVFVEVVEGRKKILVVAPGPHPDIKMFREVIEKNSNYEFLLHIPGIEEQQASSLQPENIDLAIFHQSPDVRGRTRDLFQKFINTKTSLFIVLGQQTDLISLGKQKTPVKFDAPPREYDDVTPAINPTFSNFELSEETHSIIAAYPPVSVHFGKVRVSPTATTLLHQQIGSLKTEKPLLTIDNQDNRKIGVLLGEGVWRWRLNEFDRTENTVAVQEIFGKLFQFLTTTEDKRKFKSYPVKQEFSDTESIVFESQVYNDIYEPIFGNTIKITLTDDQGALTKYSYVTSSGNTRYEVGGLREGVYKFKSSTELNGKTEEVRGEFAVVAPQSELQNLTADFDLLRKLASSSGGKFYKSTETDELLSSMGSIEAQQTIHTEENFSSLLNLKIVFWILIILISFEWFIRKYFGSY